MLEVAPDAPHQADVGVRVDVHLRVEARAQALVGQDEDALDDDDRGGLDAQALGAPVVDGEVVGGTRDGAALRAARRGAR